MFRAKLDGAKCNETVSLNLNLNIRFAIVSIVSLFSCRNASIVHVN